MHFLCLMFLPQRPFRLSRRAASNTSLTPLPVFALHSLYPAPISLATAAPCSGATGAWPCADSIRMVVESDRRSVLVPIRRRGVVGQKWDTSGYHLVTRKELERASAGEFERWCWMYLVQNVGEARREVDREYDEDNITFWIAQRA